MHEPRTIIFDLDDTLIETSVLYLRVIDRFVEDVVRELPGADAQAVRELQDEIDVRAAETVGFSKDRFPWSLAETYRVLARRAGGEPRPEREAHYTAVGYTVFDTPPELVDGARELLDALHGSVELLLYTLGVPEVQRAKVEHHGLERVFSEVHIVPRKSREQLAQVIAERDPAHVVVVGDSLRGEIAPAVALGCRAVWVRREGSWSYHHATVDGAYDAIDRIGDLRGLLRLEPRRARESA